MAESLPTRRVLYKKTTDPDNAWVEAVGGEFQAEDGVEYEICCVGPSGVATKTWTADYGNAFAMTVRTTSPNETFTWPGRNQATDALFDWGDGTSDHITAYDQAELTHTYAVAGDYDVKVIGTCGAPYFNGSGDKLKARNIKNWGNLGATVWSNAFNGCSNLIVDATDAFGANVTDMSYMFRDCTAFNQSVSNFDTSNVTDMSYMFRNCPAFNQPVSNFDTSNVTNMSNMFYACVAFNQPVSNFDTSKVTNMFNMFRFCVAFNQPISNFDTSKVTNMSGILYSCIEFNQSNVDGFLQRLYQDRLLRTFTAPALELPTAPSGTYQDANPPMSGKEYEWQLENGADVTYKWSITY